MTYQYSPARLLSASLLAAGLSSLSAPAMALDADDFATKVAAISSQGGGKFSFSSVEPDGNTIVLKDITVEVPGQGPYEIGDITFTGVAETGDGGYSADSASFDDFEHSDGPQRVAVADIEMQNLIIPPVKTAYDTDDNLDLYESISTGAVLVERDGAKVLSMSGLLLTIDEAEDGSRVDMAMSGSDLEIDPGQIDDPKVRETMSELGYETLSGEFSVGGAWLKEAGEVNVEESLSLDEVGELTLSVEISGYTLEFVEAMQQAQTAAAANPDPQAAQQAMGIAMLGMLQQLSFNSASIRFEDASVTERALQFAGKKQGVSGDDMRMAVKGMMPLMLGRIGIPELQMQISAAVGAFLDNPQNITITAEPDAPVAAPVIMGAAMGDPKSLVDLLNVQITANE